MAARSRPTTTKSADRRGDHRQPRRRRLPRRVGGRDRADGPVADRGGREGPPADSELRSDRRGGLRPAGVPDVAGAAAPARGRRPRRSSPSTRGFRPTTRFRSSPRSSTSRSRNSSTISKSSSSWIRSRGAATTRSPSVRDSGRLRRQGRRPARRGAERGWAAAVEDRSPTAGCSTRARPRTATRRALTSRTSSVLRCG